MGDRFRLDPDGYYRSPLLEQFSWLRHGFGTRASAGPGPLHTAFAKQIHSATILDARGRAGWLGEGDSLISSTPCVAVSVKTADCVPMLIADSEQRVVAAVHAGWRGTVQEIARLTLERLKKDYGTKPTQVFAAIGPAIGECCFEVGPEVAREFSKWNANFAATVEKEHVNLEMVNFSQLKEGGVPEEQIDCAGLCTMCNDSRFFSFRKEREAAGRMQSWIVIQ